jgi:uncharacterized coiled-coil DUF342 family protein
MHNLADQINAANPTIEGDSGDFFPFIKAYSVSGRGGGLRIVIDSELVKVLQEEISDLKSDSKLNAETEKELKKEIANLEDELSDSAEKHENELNSAENALQDFEFRTGFKTSARSLNARILELADHVVELQEKLENMISCAKDKKFY